MDHNIIAQETHAGTTFDASFGDFCARNLAQKIRFDLYDVDDPKSSDLRKAELIGSLDTTVAKVPVSCVLRLYQRAVPPSLLFPRAPLSLPQLLQGILAH